MTEKPDNARNKAYTAATTALRDLHREEFDDLLGKAYADAGLTPRRRKSAAEKAAEEAEKAAAKVAKAEEKRLAKIAELKAALSVLEDQEAVVEVEAALDDPGF